MTTTINASNSGGGGLVQTADASGVLALQTAGVTAVTVDASQNVGIGTASPGVRLDIRTAALGTALQLSDDTNYGANFIGVSGGLKLAMNGSQTFSIFQSTNERLTVTTAGVIQAGTGTGEVFAQNSLKFWVCMQASTGTAYNSFGLSSTSKISTGTFQLNYTRTMASSRYGCAGAGFGAGNSVAFGAESTTGIRMFVFTSSSGSLVDNDAMGNMGGGS